MEKRKEIYKYIIYHVYEAVGLSKIYHNPKRLCIYIVGLKNMKEEKKKKKKKGGGWLISAGVLFLGVK